ncbi:hypothetical protein A2949_03220 [Candidatus Adlerbacteria bacterium RIFCSPLOWO2_01_FULL_54_21b]|uniref:Uncharacterized protein n=1 Tax=Candidatus Adlerbacteria bacterium RIFCSPLOWO2_01_FULL_54_21b TaxID=1797245 RepID=A0A1F4XXA4_9BACT|nr:MAG: hypothetical protein A2949_03220 [Candidatus Adlerbacteria bacterium RIFCSPLOWO2_01_FULL_54_21b]
MTVKAALFPAVNPPANVLVAAVPVAWNESAYGVVEETTFPALSNASKVDGLMFERFRKVPASKVNVPDVKLSEVSERRNWVESMPSNVVASPPLEVRQLPSGIWKQPALKAIPLLNVEVAPEVNCNAPPEITIPEEVALNPGAINPEYIVDVPDWKLPTPCTDRIEPGVVVPMPIVPANKLPEMLPAAPVPIPIVPAEYRRIAVSIFPPLAASAPELADTLLK